MLAARYWPKGNDSHLEEKNTPLKCDKPNLNIIVCTECVNAQLTLDFTIFI